MQNIFGEDVYWAAIRQIVKRKCGVWNVFRKSFTGINSLLLLNIYKHGVNINNPKLLNSRAEWNLLWLRCKFMWLEMLIFTFKLMYRMYM